MGWNKVLSNPQQNDNPCKQLQAIPSQFSNVEMFQRCTISIMRKIKLLPHVILKAGPLQSPLLPPALSGQEECDHDVARGGGDQTYSKVSFLS